MASTEFPEAVTYALSCAGLEYLRLKPKQEEALVHLYDGHGVFAWFSTGYGKSYATNCCPLCSTSNEVF